MIDKYCDDMSISPISTRETDGCLALNVSVTKRIIAHFPRESSALLQPITVEIHPTLHYIAMQNVVFVFIHLISHQKN